MSGGGVRRIEVTEHESPVFGGTEFGAVWSYERLHGTVFGELDPRHPLNAGIVNLDRAVRNSRGNVEFSAVSEGNSSASINDGDGELRYGSKLVEIILQSIVSNNVRSGSRLFKSLG